MATLNKILSQENPRTRELLVGPTCLVIENEDLPFSRAYRANIRNPDLGHYSLTEGDKSYVWQVTYRPTDTAVASATSVSCICRDLPRMCFEQVSLSEFCEGQKMCIQADQLVIHYLPNII